MKTRVRYEQVHLNQDKITYAGWRSGGDGSVGDGSSILGRIGATKSKLTIIGGCSAAADGFEVDTQDLAGDQSLRVGIVNDGGNFRGAANGTFSKISGTKSNDTIDTRETSCR